MSQRKQKTEKPKTEHATEAKRFTDFVKRVVSVPKEEIDKREAEYQKNKVKKQSAKAD